MTRVNVVPPATLADQHLFAEFRELKMVPMSLRRSLLSALRAYFTGPMVLYHGLDLLAVCASKGDDPVADLLRKLPQVYTLGKGHVSFFYDKGAFLHERYAAVRAELDVRGVNYNQDAELDPLHVFDTDARLRLGYVPTPEAIAINRERIKLRLAERPMWYRWTQGAAT